MIASCFPVRLTGVTEFSFGVFIAMPLVLALPGIWGVLVGLLAAVPSLVDPHAMVILPLAGLECLWLKMTATKIRSATFADVIFWAAIGIPAELAINTRVAQWIPEYAAILPLLHALNSLPAVLIGEVIGRSTRFTEWLAVAPRSPRPLRTLIFNWVFILAAIPVVVMVLGFTVLLRRSMDASEAAQLKSAVDAMGTQMSLHLQSHRAAIMTAERTIFRDTDSVGPMLEETRRVRPAMLTMLVTDETGRVVETSPHDDRLIGISVADRSYFVQTKKTLRPYTSGVFRGRGFGHDILMAIAVPRLDEKGQFAGIIEGSVEVNRFVASISRSRLGVDVSLVVADADDRVVFADRGLGIEALERLSQSPLAEMPTDRVMSVEIAVEKGRSLPAEVQVGTFDLGIQVFAIHPMVAQLAYVFWIYLLFVVILLTLIGGAVWMAAWASRTLASPLERFAVDAVDQAESGSLVEISAPTGHVPREVAMVFAAFNVLAARVREAHTALKETNAALDARVAERTKELQAAQQRAEAASRSKTDFVAMTGHEIRTPLNALIGLSDVLADELPPGVSAERVRTIRRTGVRMLGIVNDLLDLSRVEAGKLELHQAPVELGGLAREVIGLFEAQARRQKLGLELSVDAKLPLWLQIDSDRLQQVLNNLIGNALKFTREGSVRLRIQAIAATEKDVTVRFAVIDSGPGIKPEEQTQLFQPYVQLAGPGASGIAGTGLGLSISRRLVELFGGKLGITSALGQGSEFHFSATFVRAVAVQAMPTITAVEEISLRDLRVLVVDDNAANQEVLRAFLEAKCNGVECVDNARSAIEMLHAMPFDVALIDLEMPEAGGEVVARAMRDMGSKSVSYGCVLIAVSAHTREERRPESLAVGFDEFVPKPIDRQELFRTMHECVLRSHSQ